MRQRSKFFRVIILPLDEKTSNQTNELGRLVFVDTALQIYFLPQM